MNLLRKLVYILTDIIYVSVNLLLITPELLNREILYKYTHCQRYGNRRRSTRQKNVMKADLVFIYCGCGRMN